MADYSAYLPQTPPSSAFIGLSPEETAQLAQYRTPDNVGRIHPMGGHAIAGRQRYQEGMGQYLDAVVQGNQLRQHQLQQVMRNNLAEAGINQMGRLGPELIRSGNAGLMANSLFAEDQLPGLTAEGGGPSDEIQQADLRAQAIKEAGRQKDVATSANQMVQGGYEPGVQALADEYKLPLTKTDPLALKVAALHAAATRSGGSGGAPVVDYTETYLDRDKNSPTFGHYVQRKHYQTRAQATAGGGSPAAAGGSVLSGDPAATVSSAATTGSTSEPDIPYGYTKVEDEDLSDEQAAAVPGAAEMAQQEGYVPVATLTAPDGNVVLMVRNAAGHHLEIPLNEVTAGGGAPDDETGP